MDLRDDEIDDVNLVVSALGVLGDRFGKPAESEPAMVVLRRSVEILERLELRGEFLAAAYSNLSWALRVRGNLQEALELAKKEVAVRKDVGDRKDLVEALGRQAVITEQRGDAAGALALHQQEEVVAEGIGDVEKRLRAVAEQARLEATSLGAMATSAATLRRAHQIATTAAQSNAVAQVTELMSGAAFWMINQAALAEDRSELDAAVQLLSEAEALAQDAGRAEPKILARYNRALLIATKKGDAQSAYPIAQDVAGAASKAGLKDLASSASQLVRAIRSELGISP